MKLKSRNDGFFRNVKAEDEVCDLLLDAVRLELDGKGDVAVRKMREEIRERGPQPPSPWGRDVLSSQVLYQE